MCEPSKTRMTTLSKQASGTNQEMLVVLVDKYQKHMVLLFSTIHTQISQLLCDMRILSTYSSARRVLFYVLGSYFMFLPDCPKDWLDL